MQQTESSIHQVGTSTRPMKESDFQQAVIEYARANGCSLIYHTRESRGSESGFPDLVIPKPPILYIVETKKDGGRLTKGRVGGKNHDRWLPGQQEWLEALKACFVVSVNLWRPSDWQYIEETLGR